MADEGEASTSITESVLACNCCRKRKLRCSRELPICEQCRKTGSDCEYKGGKGKPGMKPGAIENIHRRLDSLESSIRDLRSQSNSQSSVECPQSSYSILSMLAGELQRLNDRSHISVPTQQQQTPTGASRAYEHNVSSKRKRGDTESDSAQAFHARGGMPALPPHLILGLVVETYFTHVHMWIPMIQKARFHQRLLDSLERPKLLVILQAMIVAATRYVDPEAGAEGLSNGEELEVIRNWVVSTAMSSFSIESLQALIIVAFNDVGNGDATRAWSIIGSLTRTVEYLQLTIENEEMENPPLSRPFASLSSNEDCSWVEAEERRRVFWNIFNLDRFCSFTMGWNTSLTSNDVHRRLPCDISLWWQDEPVTTPYFNIWDKAAGRLGNPISFLPSHYRQTRQAPNLEDDTSTPLEVRLSPVGSSPSINMSTVGAFAYSVETTESLSQITTYFLQQKVNMKDQGEISSWLTRFKELDLRLIHWKMLLPQKWKADMARQSIRMDPNLTLAHITHNTSIILLHQPIAFPSSEWSFSARLPSSSSAETCHSAAIEVASITRNYLKTLPARLPAATQFAFCVFISARLFLIYWRYYAHSTLAVAFGSLLENLDEMSNLWAGFTDSGRLNLAGKYAETLRRLHRRSVENENFRIDPSGYTIEIMHADAATFYSESWRSAQGPSRRIGSIGHQPSVNATTPASHSETAGLDVASTDTYHSSTRLPGDLSTISQMFLDQSFIDVDRIISLDDGMFDAGYGTSSWS